MASVVTLTCWAGHCSLPSEPGAPQSPAAVWCCAAAAPPCPPWSAPTPESGYGAHTADPRSGARRLSAENPVFEPEGTETGFCFTPQNHKTFMIMIITAFVVSHAEWSSLQPQPEIVGNDTERWDDRPEKEPQLWPPTSPAGGAPETVQIKVKEIWKINTSIRRPSTDQVCCTDQDVNIRKYVKYS